MLENELKEILPNGERYSHTHLKITKVGNEYTVTYGAMYERPKISLDNLIKLAELFGTTEIEDDAYGYGGCETCDWGSDYGTELIIRNPTKNANELKLLVGQDL